MVDRAYTDAELEAAIAAIADPERLRAAQDLVARAPRRCSGCSPPRSRRAAGSTSATTRPFTRRVGHDDFGERVRAVRTLLAEETRLGMLVGVAVGFELARELAKAPTQSPPTNLMTSRAPGSQTTEED